MKNINIGKWEVDENTQANEFLDQQELFLNEATHLIKSIVYLEQAKNTKLSEF